MTTAQISYRKTQSGEWVAFGPADALRSNTTVTITKRDGTTKTEHIVRIGRPFSANGRQMVYGYIAPKARRSQSGCPFDGDCLTFTNRLCRHCGG